MRSTPARRRRRPRRRPSPDSGQTEALTVLAGQFGSRVAELVSSVTNPPHEPGNDRHQEYREHVTASLEANPWARVIKASDFTDNGVGLIHTTGPKLDSLAAKYTPLVPVLHDLIARPDAPLSDDVKQHTLDQLDRAAYRFAVVRPQGDKRATAVANESRASMDSTHAGRA